MKWEPKITCKDSERAPVVQRIPIEAEATDIDGEVICILLHVVKGQPVELELYKHNGSQVEHLPEASAMELILLGTSPENLE